MEFCGLDRLLQHRRVRKLRDDGIGPVTCHECERYFSVGEDVRNRISLFAPQIHVENAGLQVVALRRKHGIAEPVVGTVDFVPEGGEHIGEHHRDQRLVFDEQDKFFIRIGVLRWRAFRLAQVDRYTP